MGGMTPEDYFAWLERRLDSAARSAVEQTAVKGEQLIRNQMPDYRIKTKQALRHFIRRQGNGYRVTYGLRFRTRYQNFDTSHSSYRIFRQAWRESRDQIRQLFKKQLMRELNQ